MSCSLVSRICIIRRTTACRLSEANGVLNHWELAFKDPSESHPAGEYICGACEAAAKRDWDPCEEYRKARDRRDQEEWQDDEEGSGTEEEGAEDEEENSEQEEAGAEEEGSEEEELESWEGVADVTHLREHAATRKHILNMQVISHAVASCVCFMSF